MTTENFTPIPSLPGYAVNALGQCQSKSGLLLGHDGKGRVRVRLDGKPRTAYPGELLALAGMMRSGSEDALEATRLREALLEAGTRIEGLELLLQKAEAEAALTRARADGLEAQCCRLSKPLQKVAPVSDRDECNSLLARCKTAEALAKKIEAQRDNLAARLLTMQVELANAKARVKIAKATAGRSMALGNVENLEDL